MVLFVRYQSWGSLKLVVLRNSLLLLMALDQCEDGNVMFTWLLSLRLHIQQNRFQKNNDTQYPARQRHVFEEICSTNQIARSACLTLSECHTHNTEGGGGGCEGFAVMKWYYIPLVFPYILTWIPVVSVFPTVGLSPPPPLPVCPALELGTSVPAADAIFSL